MSSATPTRERIVDEAMRLFSEHGYAATSIAKIEAAAGLTPGAGGIYHHFASKEAVLAAGIERQLSRLGALREIRQRARIVGRPQSRTDADGSLRPCRARQRVRAVAHPRLRRTQPTAAAEDRRRAARELHVHGLRHLDRRARRARDTAPRKRQRSPPSGSGRCSPRACCATSSASQRRSTT